MIKHYHFIGIGGIGMSGIARLFISRGHKVTGSDLKENRMTGELRGSGAQVFIGHKEKNTRGADFIVYSSAIKEDNPEIREARRLGIPLIKRAQALAELMRDKSVITVAGSHGKTTISSLVAYLLLEAGLSPTMAIGGIFKNIGNNAESGCGDYFVAEADESDGSFLYYQPKYSIITNVDREHLDYYKDFSNEIQTFGDFINKTQEDGCVFCCSDDINLRALAAASGKRRVMFGLEDGADVRPGNIKMEGLSSEFDCFYRGRPLEHFRLALGGTHNISNALSVIALAMELKISPEVVKRALAGYKGAGRRLEVKFTDGDYTLIDDYAHHPTEIKASLSALRNFKSKRLVAVFQPHRFSRTQMLMDEFAASFDLADCIIVTDIYPAGEQPIEGVDSLALCDRIRRRSPGKFLEFLPKDKITEHILKTLQPGDLVVTLGAGDIIKNCDELAQRLKK
ncbi:MAG: UDP-N-acetylmuramate--L-alanine ligase [Candidatus Omnitrophica bacterium]|jgi:UDP-N-acetylmuramate--alanine ligase|nr:UDP-N-acetylmuramate--L-alanine ligase [Candidatus Omnitrophota bacterium]